MIIGLSCLLSGEDFSKVSEIKPMFYPGREDLVGREIVKAQNFCQLPMFVLGFFFFIIMSLLAFAILDRYSALFVTTFFAFNTFTLNYSRYIHVDIILWFFLALNLYFIYETYRAEKYSKKEKVFFGLSAISIALAGATKLSFGLFLLFDLFIIGEKYLQEIKLILNKLLNLDFHVENANIMNFIKLIALFGIIFAFFFLLPFQFSLGNVFDVYQTYKSHSPMESGISFNLNIFSFLINNFLYELNLIELALFLISLYTLGYLIINKKTTEEKFILYYVCLLIIAFVFFKALHFTRVALPYLFSFIFLMALTFSSRNYSILNLFKEKKRIAFFVFIIIYIAYSFYVAFSTSPYFAYANPLICKISETGCNPALSTYAAKDLGNLMNSMMNDNETFILQPAELFFYSRPEQGLEDWNFYLAFRQQFGRDPNLEEKVVLFTPNNRAVRYLIVDPKGGNQFQAQIDQLTAKYEPNEKLILKDQEVYWIYDLQNIREK
nr:phospholipid carrier-dependent glycosyltransferase [Candidatus Woesearchaeota archaeon]